MPLVIVVVSGLGLYYLTGSHAAAPFASLNANQGTLGCGASASADSTASDGNKVTFSTCNSGGGGGATCNSTLSPTSGANVTISSATGGPVICVAAGTYGSLSITGSGTSSSRLTIEPNPSLDPNGAGKVTFDGITVAANYVTAQNFYSTNAINVGSSSPFPGFHDDVINHNAVGPTSGYGISILSATSTPSYNITISGNIIHNTSATSEGDALRFDGWHDVTVTGNNMYNIDECAGNGCHTDTLQSEQLGVATSNLTITKNYIHDNSGAQGFPFLSDGDIANVTMSDNLSLRMASNGEATGMYILDNTNSLTINNNTYQGTSGSVVQSSGSASNPTINVGHNVFDTFRVLSGGINYVFSAPEDYDIFTDPSMNDGSGNSIGTTNLGSHSSFNTNPGYKCGSSCGSTIPPTSSSYTELTGPTTDDYELASNPNGIGIDWNPANQVYGPTMNP